MSKLVCSQRFLLRIEAVLPLLLLFCCAGQPASLRARGRSLLETFSAASDAAIEEMLQKTGRSDVYAHVSSFLAQSAKKGETLRKVVELYARDPGALVSESRSDLVVLSRLIGRNAWPAVSLKGEQAAAVLEGTVDAQHYQAVLLGDDADILDSLLCLAGA